MKTVHWLSHEAKAWNLISPSPARGLKAKSVAPVVRRPQPANASARRIPARASPPRLEREDLRRATISSPPLGPLPNHDPAGQWGGQPAHRLAATPRPNGSKTRIAMITAVEHGRGTASTAPVSSRVYAVISFRAGRILRYQEFYDERQALDAADATD